MTLMRALLRWQLFAVPVLPLWLLVGFGFFGGGAGAFFLLFLGAAILLVFLAVLAGVVGMLVGNGLPRLYHPVFNVARFADASRDGFFLVIRADDPRYDSEATRQVLLDLGPLFVDEVPA